MGSVAWAGVRDRSALPYRMSFARGAESPCAGRRAASRHKEVCEKYQIQYSSQPKLFRKELPPRHPPFERPPFRLSSPAPPTSRAEDWRMPLTEYRKPPKYPEHVPTYEQSMIDLSRRIRNRSLPPPHNFASPLPHTGLGRQFPSAASCEDHNLFLTRHSPGPQYVGSGRYQGRRSFTPARGF